MYSWDLSRPRLDGEILERFRRCVSLRRRCEMLRRSLRSVLRMRDMRCGMNGINGGGRYDLGAHWCLVATATALTGALERALRLVMVGAEALSAPPEEPKALLAIR